MAKKIPKLSQAEWMIMKICWEQGKSPARAIYEEALKNKKWEYQTVKTMLDRLVVKRYLQREKLGPLCLYRPRVPRTRAITKAIDTFVETVLDDTIVPLFAHLARSNKLSDKEIASLKKLIDEREEG